MHEADPTAIDRIKNIFEKVGDLFDRYKYQVGVLAVAAVAAVAPSAADSHQDNSRLTLEEEHPALETVTYGSVEPISEPNTYINPRGVNYRLPALRWPVKPFFKPHPIRATFGEPRAHITKLPEASERPEYIMHHLSNEARMIPEFRRRPHVGIDIAAPDGSPVYAVTSGRVRGVNPRGEMVGVGNTEYVHLNRRKVKNGQYVRAGKLLGFVRPMAEHVHFNIRKGDRYIDPLSYRRFAGYRDTKAPVIERLIALKPNGEEYQPGDGGKVELFVKAYDENNAMESGGAHHRRTGVKSVSYVLQNAVTGKIIEKKTVWKFERLPDPDTFKLALNPLSERIRPPSAYRKPDVADFIYRLTKSGQFSMPQDDDGDITRILTVGTQDSFGNQTTQQFGL